MRRSSARPPTSAPAHTYIHPRPQGNELAELLSAINSDLSARVGAKAGADARSWATSASAWEAKAMRYRSSAAGYANSFGSCGVWCAPPRARGGRALALPPSGARRCWLPRAPPL